jgi:hypothetical protein
MRLLRIAHETFVENVMRVIFPFTRPIHLANKANKINHSLESFVITGRGVAPYNAIKGSRTIVVGRFTLLFILSLSARPQRR